MQTHAYERVLLTEARLRVNEGERRARQLPDCPRPPLRLHTLLVTFVHLFSL